MRQLGPGHFYILFHQPSRGYMPELHKPLRGGYTHTEPTHYPWPPRLFSDAKHAKMALTWWLKGGVNEIDEQAFYGQIYGNLRAAKPRKPRVREEWMILPVEIVMQVSVSDLSRMLAA